MKGLFPEYDRFSDADYAKAWDEGLFVFDTNALLNTYRYKKAISDRFFLVLDRLSQRIWIPHHVALEFQRNRLKVIGEQTKKFVEVRGVIEKARTPGPAPTNMMIRQGLA